MPRIRRSPHSIFNRRRSRHAAFRLGIALVVKPTPYNMLITNMLITPEAKALQR